VDVTVDMDMVTDFPSWEDWPRLPKLDLPEWDFSELPPLEVEEFTVFDFDTVPGMGLIPGPRMGLWGGFLNLQKLCL
jgi:hypothetical protein